MGGIDMVRQVPPKTQLGVVKSNKNQLGETIASEIVYPESDGEPMADNTKSNSHGLSKSRRIRNNYLSIMRMCLWLGTYFGIQ
ncbi:hypothetical protein U9R62_10855 [Cylindrospermopsis raciborskii DSH]|uniref:hypothetical protein n=1 Tax=Cylindrospermopsis raciborskii TaxID=77022 RepID=UPI002EDB12A6